MPIQKDRTTTAPPLVPLHGQCILDATLARWDPVVPPRHLDDGSTPADTIITDWPFTFPPSLVDIVKTARKKTKSQPVTASSPHPFVTIERSVVSEQAKDNGKKGQRKWKAVRSRTMGKGQTRAARSSSGVCVECTREGCVERWEGSSGSIG
ncbi:hypothetical protein P171DRAFT_430839 [Karstenula rhodostoma CBS 690.94]|uniref:Uncharacterized protein n=1 Tax=Karstenula rhodostoma CBS 690.94 TaxID=1392251 RepID=A0A9P4PK06_9PLEO|nr:hypothetical protein P171DRAFT_430839 [Karstenula rhodostoma CBS 690.94]